MRYVDVELEGIAPLRMNRLVPDELKESASKRKKTHKDLMETAHTRSYTDKSGKYIVPSRAIEACIEAGGAKVKHGRGSAKASLKAILFVEGNEPHVLIKGKPSSRKDNKFILHEEPVRVPPRTGARVIQYWVAFPEWSLKFRLGLVDERFPIQSLKESIMEAGIYAGLLDGRPKWGRFVVKSFKEVTGKTKG